MSLIPKNGVNSLKEFFGMKIKKTDKELSAIANKAVATRRKNELARKRSNAANKAVATRRKNELARKRSNAAFKAWETRRK
jgi:hypothetical protein